MAGSLLLPPVMQAARGCGWLSAPFVEAELLRVTLQVRWQGCAHSADACCTGAQALHSLHTAGPGWLAAFLWAGPAWGAQHRTDPDALLKRAPLGPNLRDNLQVSALMPPARPLQSIRPASQGEASASTSDSCWGCWTVMLLLILAGTAPNTTAGQKDAAVLPRELVKAVLKRLCDKYTTMARNVKTKHCLGRCVPS